MILSMRMRLFAAACLLPLALLSACGGKAGDPERGRQLYLQRTIGAREAPGCVTCHSLEEGRVLVGPSHARIAQRAAEVVGSENYQGSATTIVEYLRESIVDPDAYVVPGFDPNLMYENYREALTEDQIEDLVAFLLTLE